MSRRLGQRLALALALALAAVAAPLRAEDCPGAGVAVQVLGSGGPELRDRRASSGYLVWHNGRAQALIDAGGGVALRFGESGARMTDLDVILLSHLHVDHSADLAPLIKAAWFEERRRPLPVFGPPGNNLMPSTVAYARALFDRGRGAYRYLGQLLTPLDRSTYKLKPHDVSLKPDQIGVLFRGELLAASAVPVSHGGFPALAWRVELDGKSIVFSGDGNGEGDGLERLAHAADLLIAHHAVAEDASGVERGLHMPPSAIGRIAHAAQAKQLVLSHRMTRTLGREDESLAAIRRKYDGPVSFANDLDCFVP